MTPLAIEHRETTLTEKDIQKIVKALAHERETCRFGDIEPHEMKAAVDFFKHFTRNIEEGKSTFRKAVITYLVNILFTVVGAGTFYIVYIAIKKAMINGS